jgi:hypothetical protein
MSSSAFRAQALLSSWLAQHYSKYIPTNHLIGDPYEAEAELMAANN